jgi:hypothetical protein
MWFSIDLSSGISITFYSGYPPLDGGIRKTTTFSVSSKFVGTNFSPIAMRHFPSMISASGFLAFSLSRISLHRTGSLHLTISVAAKYFRNAAKQVTLISVSVLILSSYVSH